MLSSTNKGLKVNKLDERGKPVGSPIWGTWEEVTGRPVQHEYCFDMSPAQISAFIRRRIFNKNVDATDVSYYLD